jgi:hypothetical protein
MSILELLANFVPDINFHVGDEVHDESTNIVIVNGSEGDAPEQVPNGEVVDVEQFDEEERDQVQNAIGEWSSFDEIFRDSTGVDKAAIERNLENEEIEETLDYFRSILPQHYYDTLEASLHFRKQVNMMDPVDNDWVHQRRKDMAERFDGDTYQVINLCSAGYFDEGRYLRELYEEMAEEDDYREGDFADAFNDIVNQKPFTIFVSNNDTEGELVGDIKQRVRDHEKYDIRVDFIDVRGMGRRNRHKIKNGLAKLADDVGDFKMQELAADPELVIKINPSTVDLSEDDS